MIGRALRNLRRGRVQRTLSAMTAASAAPPGRSRRSTSSTTGTGASGVSRDAVPRRAQHPVEGDPLDADVVVEVLEVAQVPDGRAHVGADLGGAVQREVHRPGVAEGRNSQQRRDAATAGDIGLQAVDRARGEHVLEVGQVIPVFAGRDVHAGRPALAELA